MLGRTPCRERMHQTAKSICSRCSGVARSERKRTSTSSGHDTPIPSWLSPYTASTCWPRRRTPPTDRFSTTGTSDTCVASMTRGQEDTINEIRAANPLASSVRASSSSRKSHVAVSGSYSPRWRGTPARSRLVTEHPTLRFPRGMPWRFPRSDCGAGR
jgi:hypothetical protein